MRVVLSRLGLGFIVFACLLSCASPERVADLILPGPPVTVPETTFAVFSDPHYYDPSLGTEGAAYQAYLISDRKLLKESGELFDAVVSAVAATPVQFVLVCGDLTKDGEASGHHTVAGKLRRLKDAGKTVLVVPGNHDVMNGAAVRYVGEGTEPVPTVTAAEFAEIYADFGYGAAIERDPASLSYVSEPVAGLWVLALDTCLYRDNRPGHHPLTGGAYSKETVPWIVDVLNRARAAQKAVIVFQHHGVMEHYPNNEKYYKKYMVDDYEAMGNMLSRGGVSLVFTGHFHAQDITQKAFDDGARVLYDIETGSTVTAPCPYRLVTITAARQAVIESRFITSIPSHPEGFSAFTEDYLFTGTLELADEALKKYMVGEKDRQLFNPQVAAAYATHLKGDEPKPVPALDTSGAGFWGRFVFSMQADLLTGWYTDLPPADHNVVLDLVRAPK
ncbi:MAG: metallophosphoesterase [Pseudomonadota bacterium]